VIYAQNATQLAQAQRSKTHFQAALRTQGFGEITTEIKELIGRE